MKILAIGDPHGNLDKIKKIPIKSVELILITGDLGKADLARKFAFENIKLKQQGLPELEETPAQKKNIYLEIHNSTISVLSYLSKYAPVYTIQGNVGIPAPSEVKEIKLNYGITVPSTLAQMNKIKNVGLTKNRLRVINNIRIGFLEYFTDTCWVQEFKPKEYAKAMKNAKKETEKAKRILSRFKNIDILVCHQPPYGYLDKVNFPGVPDSWKGKHAGSKTILQYIKSHQPEYVFCGHIHEGEGFKKLGKTQVCNLGVAGYKIIEF